jgi:arsenate reductase
MIADRVYNVLFLCTGNSARSILAESILNAEGKGRFRAFSAGSHPKGQVHPWALKTLDALGYPATGFSSKSWDVFAETGAPQMDFIFTVCDNAAGEACPVWLGHPMTAHWGVEDPAAIEGSDIDVGRAFALAARYLKNRITLFINLPIASIDKLALETQLRQIGASEGATSLALLPITGHESDLRSALAAADLDLDEDGRTFFRIVGGSRSSAQNTPATVARRAARHASAAVRLPGRADYRPADHHRVVGRADPDPGLLQLRSCLSAQPDIGRATLRRRAVSLIGASNFFELAVAAAISLFGFNSGAALATVVGVLIEVPVMLSVVWIVNRSRRAGTSAAPPCRQPLIPNPKPLKGSDDGRHHLSQSGLRHVAQHAGHDPNAGIEPTVIEYLNNPPSRDQLVKMIADAGLTVREAIREKGTPYANWAWTTSP